MLRSSATQAPTATRVEVPCSSDVWQQVGKAAGKAGAVEGGTVR
jgi:hypothetical protein